MKIQLLSLLIFIFSLSVSAQDTLKSETTSKRFRHGVYLSLDHTRSSKPEFYHPYYNGEITQAYRLGNQFGYELSCIISPAIQLNTGLQLSTRKTGDASYATHSGDGSKLNTKAMVNDYETTIICPAIPLTISFAPLKTNKIFGDVGIQLESPILFKHTLTNYESSENSSSSELSAPNQFIMDQTPKVSSVFSLGYSFKGVSNKGLSVEIIHRRNKKYLCTGIGLLYKF